MALNLISLSYNLKKSVSSLLIVQKKKKRTETQNRAPKHGSIWGLPVTGEDPNALSTTWRGEFRGKLVYYLLLWLQLRVLPIFII